MNDLMNPETPAQFAGHMMLSGNDIQGFNQMMASGNIAQRLLATNCDPDALRPMWGSGVNKNRSFIRQRRMTANGEYKDVMVPVANANTLLRKDEWIKMDEAVTKVARQEMRLWADLVASGATYSIPDGMGVTSLMHEKQSDTNAATISMDGLRRGNRDRPEYSKVVIPCPIIHKDCNFGIRDIMASRRGNTPLDITSIEQATVKVTQLVEQLTAGSTSFTYSAGAAYGSGTIQGYANFTDRLTKTFTSPATAGWIPATTVNEVLDAVLSLSNVAQYGPFMLYHAPTWDKYLDDDYSMAKGDNTLRDRLKKISVITDVRRANYLSNYDMVFVALGKSQVAQAVTGMALNVVQWETEGGMEVHYKVMCIMFPRLRSTVLEGSAATTSTGILHATV